MYDHQTRTLWSQINGEPMAGPTNDLFLEPIASTVTTWSAWLERHPDTLVLVKPKLKRSIYQPYHNNPHRMGIAVAKKGDLRFQPKALVYGLKHAGAALAVSLEYLESHPVQNTQLGSLDVLLIYPGQSGEALAFSRQVQGRLLTFRLLSAVDGLLVQDVETQSTWDGLRGFCTEGELKGLQLDPVPGTPIYWSIWSRYYPKTAVLPQN